MNWSEEMLKFMQLRPRIRSIKRDTKEYADNIKTLPRKIPIKRETNIK